VQQDVDKQEMSAILLAGSSWMTGRQHEAEQQEMFGSI
jgi:hypothetical protein